MRAHRPGNPVEGTACGQSAQRWFFPMNGSWGTTYGTEQPSTGTLPIVCYVIAITEQGVVSAIPSNLATEYRGGPDGRRGGGKSGGPGPALDDGWPVGQWRRRRLG